MSFFGSTGDLKTLDRYRVPKLAFDSLSAHKTISDLIRTLQNDGFLLATAESIIFDKDNVKVYVRIGENYQWAALDPGNIDEGILSSVGYREKFYRNSTFSYKEVSGLLKKIVRYSESNGFPFATVRLDSISIEGPKIHASLNYESGPLITFDTVELSGGTKSKPIFLSSYLRIKPGTPYDEKKIEQAASKLGRLPYLKVNSPAYVTFQLKKGTAHFDLSDVKSNQVDGIIGLLPNEGSGGKSLITGQFNLLLNNLFGTGKMVSFQWQRPEVNSQNLDIQYAHPNLLRSPVNVQAGFTLLKEDTLFINRNLTISASLLVGKNGKVSVNGNFKVARVISEEAIASELRMAELADFNLNQYGIGYEWNNLNNMLLPTRGFAIDMRAAVGNKSLKRNAGFDASYYDSIQMKTVQYDFEGTATYYHQLGKRIILKSKLAAGSILGDQLFVNDLYRIGGLNSLRGFQENDFFASRYAIGSLESQFFLDNESYLFFFYDQGYLIRDTHSFSETYPAGLGTGLTFSTNAGIFSFVYALGKMENQPFSISFSKIHFGYITRF